ncbi:hypothetical protein X797_008784 [Metarhizium robertsii]|uniref:Uncharacterized protein n=1 Tax=Metarhizium robertsii TaxID=568076 RepID=A0A0A1URB3_9HYPO|nr:hypothetical protein X797_008784 [Metarhizium robertsii]
MQVGLATTEVSNINAVSQKLANASFRSTVGGLPRSANGSFPEDLQISAPKDSLTNRLIGYIGVQEEEMSLYRERLLVHVFNPTLEWEPARPLISGACHPKSEVDELDDILMPTCSYGIH